MKRRPQCDQTFNDAYLNFCLLDGTRLTIESEKQADEKIKRKKKRKNIRQSIETQVSPNRKKSKFRQWLGIIGLFIVVGSVGISAKLQVHSSLSL